MPFNFVEVRKQLNTMLSVMNNGYIPKENNYALKVEIEKLLKECVQTERLSSSGNSFMLNPVPDMTYRQTKQYFDILTKFSTDISTNVNVIKDKRTFYKEVNAIRDFTIDAAKLALKDDIKNPQAKDLYQKILKTGYDSSAPAPMLVKATGFLLIAYATYKAYPYAKKLCEAMINKIRSFWNKRKEDKEENENN